MGGSDDPSNIIELSVEEHAEAHRRLYEEYGRWQDKLAWKGLLKQIGKEEIRLEAIKEGIRTRDMSYFKTKEWSERIRKINLGKKRSIETKRKLSKPKSKEHKEKLRNHLKVHNKRKRSEEELQKLSEAAKRRDKCPYCSFESTITHVKRHIKRNHG